jgi:plasmid stability protein
MPALAQNACIAYNECMQYTIRNIPEYLDAALRSTARVQGKSLNEVAVQALARGAGISEGPRRRRDLKDIAGSWRKDPAFDSAVAAQDTIDEAMWP